MSRINVLDKKIYNRISAGEVVERPASVVKELVENSIDAGATLISINIVDGGKTLIEVIDNGHGILKDDMLKAVMPHATSKISSVKDLDNIQTLGFRGEALASIASVSKLNITSRVEESEIGYSLDVEGGESKELEFVPAHKGTCISVYNLFYNVPARFKFLKSDKSEESEVSDVVSRLILANPTISIKYTSNSTTIFNSFGEGKEDALISIYGFDAIKNSFKIKDYKHGINVEGYLGKHNFVKSNRTYQTIILNGRYIKNITIQTAIYNAYQSYLMKRKYPFYVLYIDMPTEFVDVNVTPNKSDVRFIDNSIVYGVLYSLVSKILDGTDSALEVISLTDMVLPSPNDVKEELKALKQKQVEEPKRKIDDKYNVKYVKDNFDDNFIPKVAEDVFSEPEISQVDMPNIQISDIFAENKRYIEEMERKKQLSEQVEFSKPLELNYIGQVLDSFLIFEALGDMYIIDQHAAHERLLYNKLLYNKITGDIAVQPLLVPYTLTLNSKEYEIISKKLDYLKDLGIEIHNKGGEFSVHSLPIDIAFINLDDFFNEILDDQSLKTEIVPDIIKEKLMQKACKSAVKAGMKLDSSEVKSLIKLLNGDITLKCPHGRPIAVKITRTEIDKWFKRIVWSQKL